MFKGSIAVALLMLMMFQSLMQLSVIAYYKLNVDEIESLYCVNKDKPDLCCKGQCYISGQLEKHKQNLPSGQITEERNLPLFILPSFILKDRSNCWTILFPTSISSKLLKGFPNQLLHPPDVA